MRSFLTLSKRTPRLDPLAPVPLDDRQRRLAHLAASVLLAYPDAGTREAARELADAVVGLPGPVAERLGRACAALGYADEEAATALETRYVATFDLKRRCSMYLTYYVAGDTRRRGVALVRFVEAYRAAGWELGSEELPDYLPTVLELSARTSGDDARIAAGLLGAHREGIEVLRSALAGTQPWDDVVEAVCLTLPPLDPETEARYTALVTDGPPTEMVGLTALGPLEPYAPTASDVLSGAPGGDLR
jgi:nitrate reductase delta subunit